MTDYRNLVEQLVSPNPDTQLFARRKLLSLQEDAVEGLSDVYYGGVNDAEGAAVLDVVAEIGGFEAMSLLRNVFALEDNRPKLRHAAAKGLLHNQSNLNLSPNELEDVTRFLAEC